MALPVIPDLGLAEVRAFAVVELFEGLRCDE